MYHRRFFHLLLVSLMSVLSVSLTFAIPPEKTETVEVTITDENIGSCGDFDIIENAVITYWQTFHYDQEGNVIRIQAHVKYRGTLMNSVTGKTVTDAPDPQNYMLDLQEGTRAINGLVYKITIPGKGIVVLDAGRVVTDLETATIIFEGGPHQVLHGGLEVLCAVLADA